MQIIYRMYVKKKTIKGNSTIKQEDAINNCIFSFYSNIYDTIIDLYFFYERNRDKLTNVNVHQLVCDLFDRTDNFFPTNSGNYFILQYIKKLMIVKRKYGSGYSDETPWLNNCRGLIINYKDHTIVFRPPVKAIF